MSNPPNPPNFIDMRGSSFSSAGRDVHHHTGSAPYSLYTGTVHQTPPFQSPPTSPTTSSPTSSNSRAGTTSQGFGAASNESATHNSTQTPPITTHYTGTVHQTPPFQSPPTSPTTSSPTSSNSRAGTTSRGFGAASNESAVPNSMQTPPITTHYTQTSSTGFASGRNTDDDAMDVDSTPSDTLSR